MADMTEKIKTMNSVVRTAMMLAGLGAIGIGAFLVYDLYIRPSYEVKQTKEELRKTSAELAELKRDYQQQTEKLAEQSLEIESLNVENSELKVAIEKLEVRNKLLKLDQRLAEIKVLETGNEADSGDPYMEIEFVELSPEGEPIGEKKRARLKGDMLYVDALVVKFHDRYIEENDLLRGSTLHVFQSVWGDLDGPRGGLRLDENLKEKKNYETAYGTPEEMSEFERKIWSDFWAFSNNPEKQKEFGIRAGHGQANYVKAEENKTYRVELRASDGFSLVPLNANQSNNDSSK